MCKFIKGDKYVHWSGTDSNVYEVTNIDPYGWAMGWRWCSTHKKNYLDMVHPNELRHAISKEIKFNRRLHVVVS